MQIGAFAAGRKWIIQTLDVKPYIAESAAGDKIIVSWMADVVGRVASS